MTHYISVSTTNGVNGKNPTAKRVPLQDVISAFPLMAHLNKEDNWLMYGGYIDVPDEYPRNEKECENQMKLNVIFIDCDNPNNDPLILEKFHEDMKGYCHLTWETYSSTPERPKFRALIPLDNTIKYDRDTKRAIFSIFNEYVDDHATWYFAPDTRHLNTLFSVEGDMFPSKHILEKVEKYAIEREAMERVFAAKRISNVYRAKNPDGWRNFDSVKKCLDGLAKGERDNSINAACYAMSNHGYKESIPQFLDEVNCDNEIKNKFRRQYR